MTDKLREWLSLFIKICLFRQGPEDLPYSKFAVILLLGLVSTLHLKVLMGIFPSLHLILLNMMAYFIFMGLIVYITLTMRGFKSRFVQIMMALLGIDFIFLNIELLVSVIVPSVQMYIMYVTSIWRSIVVAHIFKSGFNIKMFTAILFVLGIQLFGHLVYLSLVAIKSG